MRTRTIAILAASGVILIGGMFVVAQRIMHKGFAGHRGGPAAILRQLDLTDEQKAKVKEIMEANRGTIQPIREAMKANHEKLAAMKGPFDEAAVSEITTNQGNLTAQMIVARERVKSEIFAILTDEQKAKATELRDQMQQRFRDRIRSWDEKGGANTGAEPED